MYYSIEDVMQFIEIPQNELKELYEKQKFTICDIADIYDCCQTTIWKKMEKYEIRRLPNGRRTFIISKSKLKELYVKRRLSSRKIAKIYRCAYSTIDYKIRKYGFPVKTLAAAHITTLRKNFDESKSNKAYLIGFAMGDLRVRKKFPNSETINIDCGSTQKAQVNLIFKLFKKYGRIWISKPNKKGVTQIECFLNNSFDFLLNKRILIDKWILKNKRYFWAFLAGFTDAEGCISVSKSNNQAYYSLGNYNQFLLRQIRNYLLHNKIDCPKLSEYKTKGKVCFNKYFHNQNYWQIRICRKESLLTLFNFIGPYLKHSTKKKGLQIAKRNIALRDKLFWKK